MVKSYEIVISIFVRLQVEVFSFQESVFQGPAEVGLGGWKQ